ncbi:MAG: chorismate mutase [Ignavibacteria bacterium]|nr:chorismate mutase [Ignavibacteria bacterium]
MDSIEELRKKIDELDEQIVLLLNERASQAVKIGEEKLRLGMEAYSPEREAEVLHNVLAQNTGPLKNPQLRRVYERIIDESRAVERAHMGTESKEGRKKKK